MDKLKEKFSQLKDWFARKNKQFVNWLFNNGTKK